MPTKIEINLNTELTVKEIEKVEEIFLALLKSGGLFGVKGGQTILHFDSNADFMGVQLSYWPWKKKKLDK